MDDAERHRQEAEGDAERRHEQDSRDREDAEERYEESARRRSLEAAYRTNNPGDYKCPHCLMISLKDGAGVCPICRRDIHVTYWHEIAAERHRNSLQLAEKNRRAAEEQIKQYVEFSLKEQAHRKWLKSPDGIAEAAAKRALDRAGSVAFCSLLLVVFSFLYSCTGGPAAVKIYIIGNSIGILLALAVAFGNSKYKSHKEYALAVQTATLVLWFGVIFGAFVILHVYHIFRFIGGFGLEAFDRFGKN